MPLTAQAIVAKGPDLIGALVSGRGFVERARSSPFAARHWLDDLREAVERQGARTSASSVLQHDLLDQYTHVMAAVAQDCPLLLILDDLQWADNGSLSLLFHLGRRLAGQRILILGAYRPEEVSPREDGQRHSLPKVVNEFKRVTGEIEIDLAQAAGRALVEQLLDSEPNLLDARFRDTLYRQTDGHPLFTVELLNGMRERGDLARDASGRWYAGKDLDWEALPARVEAVIAERVGRLDDGLQDLLRACSIEGQTFTAQAIARVLKMDEGALLGILGGALDRQHRLVRADAVIQVGERRLSRYRFRHILFQRYLYGALDRAERAYLHQAVGEALESLYVEADDRADISPQLAWRFRRAGMPSQAIEYARQAGERAVRLSANEEAIAQLGQGLAMLEALPDTPARAQRELALQLLLAVPLQSQQGYGAPEVGRVLGRVRALCDQIGEAAQVWGPLTMLNLYYGIRGELDTALDLAEQLQQIAAAGDDPWATAHAHATAGWVRYLQGDLSGARSDLERVVSTYVPSRHHALVYVYGTDFGISAMAWLSCALWFHGFPDQAAALSAKTIALARDLDHAFTLNFALSVTGAQFASYRREFGAARAWAEAEMALADAERFPFYRAMSRIHLGYALTGLGQIADGIALIAAGLDICRATQARAYMTCFLANLAEAHLHAGAVAEGLGALEEAFAVCRETGERFYEAELHRLHGELLRARGAACGADAEACFTRAIEVARAQGAKAWELRATLSLAQLWRAQGSVDAAHQALRRIYGWFEEGYETPDMLEARALLDALEREIKGRPR